MNFRSTKNLLRSLITVAAAVLVAVTLVPGTAQAEDSFAWAIWRNPSSDGNGGSGELKALGERVRVRDMQSDGWGTRAQIQKLLPDGNGGKHWVDHGEPCFDDTNTSNTNGGYTVCNYNVREGIQIRLHVWASNSGEFRWHEYSPAIDSGADPD